MFSFWDQLLEIHGLDIGLRLVTTSTGVASHWHAAPNRLQGFTTSPGICLLDVQPQIQPLVPTCFHSTGHAIFIHIHMGPNCKHVSIFTPLTLVGDLSANVRDTVAKLRFDTIYNGVYNTEDLNIAWLSVLGSLVGIRISERRNEVE